MNTEIYRFIKGINLSELLYQDAVKPIINQHNPNIRYSAALIGPGSEVLGFDTVQSMDHDWGPKLILFLDECEYKKSAEAIDEVLSKNLPRYIHGIPTDLANIRSSDPIEILNDETGRINHNVFITTPNRYFNSILSFDPSQDMCVIDWISTPSTLLLSIISGKVFYDGLNAINPVRKKLQFYPDDIWYYLLAAQWARIAQEEHFMGRCGQVGDDLGSRIVASRLVRDIMRLCFLMERRYAPYTKWFGTAFSSLACGDMLYPCLQKVLAADTWKSRELTLTIAYEKIADMHNALAITAPINATVSSFYLRPFLVIHGDRFVEAIWERITDQQIRSLPKYLGSIDQFTDSTDAHNQKQLIRRVYAK